MKNDPKYQNGALLFLRLVLAAIFIVAGYAKLPLWNGPIEGMSETMLLLMKFISIVEPLGAIALIAGFLTKWASLGLAIIMVGAIFILQFTMQTGFSTATGAGWNFPLMLLAGCAILMAFGAGKWAIDSKRK